MGKPRLVLHAGLHKTGTTALQKAFASNRGRLRKHDIVYPDLPPFGRDPVEAHHKFAHAIARPKGFDMDAFQDRLAKVPETRTVLLSAEAICRHHDGEPNHPNRGGGYWTAAGDPDTYWTGRRAYLERLRNALSRFEIEPVIYLRRQDRVAQSLYFSFVDSLGYVDDFETFLEERIHWFDFDRQVSLFREVFGQATTFDYDSHVKTGLANTFLAEVFGINGLDISAPRARVTTDPRTVLWIRERNREAGAGINDWRKTVQGFTQWMNQNSPFSSSPATGYWPSQAARDAFLARYGITANDPVAPPAVLVSEDRSRITALFDEWQAAKRPH